MSLEEVEVGHSTCKPSYLELSLSLSLHSALYGILGCFRRLESQNHVVLGGAHFGCDSVLCILDVGFNAPMGT